MPSSPKKLIFDLFKTPSPSSDNSSASGSRESLLRSASTSTAALLENASKASGHAGKVLEKYEPFSTSLGIRTKEGVILAAEKRADSKLIVNDSIEKIAKIDEHIGVTYAGLIAFCYNRSSTSKPPKTAKPDFKHADQPPSTDDNDTTKPEQQLKPQTKSNEHYSDKDFLEATEYTSQNFKACCDMCTNLNNTECNELVCKYGLDADYVFY
uniref:Uncharacterized protein n=1 Tax=Panagrolaimus sp. PS1159 TaxID=55785 RepID=A0AC35FG30_9BILA